MKLLQCCIAMLMCGNLASKYSVASSKLHSKSSRCFVNFIHFLSYPIFSPIFLFYFVYLVPEPVENFSSTRISNTSVILNWSPLSRETANGIVVRYQLSISHVNESGLTTELYSTDVQANISYAVINGLGKINVSIYCLVSIVEFCCTCEYMYFKLFVE